VNPQRAAGRHRLAGVQRQVQERLAEHPGIAVYIGHVVALNDQVDAGAFRFGPHDRHDLVEERRQPDRLQLQILGPRELQERLHNFVQAADFIGNDLDVLQRFRAIDCWWIRDREPSGFDQLTPNGNRSS
jgi:hypothetical protein